MAGAGVGLDPNSLRFVLQACDIGVRFDRTLMIGRQRLNLGRSEFHDALVEFDRTSGPDESYALHEADDRYADSFFRHLGASDVLSLDNSAYQGAALLQDLNEPLAHNGVGRFTAVVDCGTLEHVFDVRTAIRNCLELVELGGHYLAVVPANNFVGHGFYQFSPEFFYRVLSPANGYSVKKCIMFTDDTIGKWFEVVDPDSIGRRVTLCNDRPTHIAVLARRDRAASIFERVPQQSDYAALWKESESSARLPESESVASSRRARQLLVDCVPEHVKSRVRRRIASTRRRWTHRNTSGFSPEFFTEEQPH